MATVKTVDCYSSMDFSSVRHSGIAVLNASFLKKTPSIQQVKRHRFNMSTNAYEIEVK